jgi:uncharacterized RDD family membrane protein YckC
MLCPNCGTLNIDIAKYCQRCGKEIAMAAPETAPVIAAQPVRAAFVYAGFWRRFGAVLIDTIPLASISWIVGKSTETPSMYWWDTDNSSDVRGFLMSAIIAWLYYAICESSRAQATLGKLVTGLYVTDEAGERLTFSRATGRHFGKYISGVLLGIGFLMAGFTAKKQALHDILAKTLVLRH